MNEVNFGDEDGLYFDAVEKVQRESYSRNPSHCSSKSGSDESEEGVDENGELIERVELPWLKDPKTKFSIWAIIKDSVGKDLSKISVPVYINDPTSIL